MLTIRCTARVRKRFRLEVLDEPPDSTTVLGSWYANLLNWGPERYVLCVSADTLLPVLMPARNAEFPSRIGGYVAEVLRGIGIPLGLVAAETEAMAQISIAKTQNRSVLGVMNDYSISATHALGKRSLVQTSVWLGKMPSGPLGYTLPIEKACEAFDVPPPPISW